jgi:hypothetical protein
MHYGCIAIPDADVPQAVKPVFQHVVTTYASEANKVVQMHEIKSPPSFSGFPPQPRSPIFRTPSRQYLEVSAGESAIAQSKMCG